MISFILGLMGIVLYFHLILIVWMLRLMWMFFVALMKLLFFPFVAHAKRREKRTAFWDKVLAFAIADKLVN